MKKEQIAFSKGIRVTTEGTVITSKGKTIGKGIDRGYFFIGVKVKGKVTIIKVHRLQAYQKYGDNLYKEGILVRHLNGNSKDNSWDNIVIGTASDNRMDIPEQSRISYATHASSFVKKYDNDVIKEYHKTSKSYKETMDKFNISSKGTLHYILKG